MQEKESLCKKKGFFATKVKVWGNNEEEIMRRKSVWPN